MRLLATAIQFNSGAKSKKGKPYQFATIQYEADFEVVNNEDRQSITFGQYHESLQIFYETKQLYDQQQKLIFSAKTKFPLVVELLEKQYISNGQLRTQIVGFELVEDSKKDVA